MLNSTKCLCDRDLAEVRFESYMPEPMNDKFYGGRVSMTGTVKCDCGRELKGYFQRINNNLKLIDLEVIKDLDEHETFQLDNEDLDKCEPLQLDNEDKSNYMPKMYDEMSYKELQEVAKEKGIKVVGIKREEIINKLEEIS